MGEGFNQRHRSRSARDHARDKSRASSTASDARRLSEWDRRSRSRSAQSFRRRNDRDDWDKSPSILGGVIRGSNRRMDDTPRNRITGARINDGGIWGKGRGTRSEQRRGKETP